MVLTDMTTAELERLVGPTREAVSTIPKPLVDPATVGIGSMLDTEPQPRRMLIPKVLPAAIAGILGGAGGVSKSTLLLQLLVSLAAKHEFLGLQIESPGGGLLIATEDEREELHRRLLDIVRAYELTREQIELLRERLFIVSRVGADNRLTAVVDGECVQTSIGPAIAALVDHLPALRIICLDPASRFRGGQENSNDDSTRFVEAIERLRADTGAAIILPHHMAKGATIGGAERLSQDAIRGASALVDGVRWAAAMATLRRDEAEDYGVAPEDAGRFVRFDVVKNNYCAPWPGMWLERTDGGVLVPTTLERRRSERQQERAEDRYREVLPRLVQLVRNEQESGHPMTRRRLRDYAGKAGLFGVGDQTLRGILERAIGEGHISATESGDSRRGMELRTWK